MITLIDGVPFDFDLIKREGYTHYLYNDSFLHHIGLTMDCKSYDTYFVPETERLICNATMNAFNIKNLKEIPKMPNELPSKEDYNKVSIALLGEAISAYEVDNNYFSFEGQNKENPYGSRYHINGTTCRLMKSERTKTEYVKVELSEKSIFDLKDDFESGNLYWRDNDESEIKTEHELVMWIFNDTHPELYRKVETEIDWIDILQGTIKNKGIEVGLGSIRVGDVDLSDDSFLTMVHDIASMTDKPEVGKLDAKSQDLALGSPTLGRAFAAWQKQ